MGTDLQKIELTTPGKDIESYLSCVHSIPILTPEQEKEIALKQKAEEEERIKLENQRIKEWEQKFDLDQKKKEEELIKKFYSDQSTNQSQDDSQIDNPSESDMDNKN